MKQASLFLAVISISLLPPAHAAPTVEVSLHGVADTIRKNVLASLSVYQERNRDDLTDARMRSLHQRAPEEIKQAVIPFGFYRPTIQSELTLSEDTWRAVYSVDLGEPLKVTELDLRLTGAGQADPQFQKLVDEFPLPVGSVLNHDRYEDAKSSFEKVAAERGYFDMKLKRHELRVDLEEYRAHVILHIDTGNRYRLGAVFLEQDILDPEFIDRYIHLQPGELYSTARLLELQNALTSADYFSEVEIIADPEEATDFEIPVRIKLRARKPNRYTFGMGYGTDTGPRARAGWERRYINTRGHRFRSEVKVSQIQNTLSASYIIPIRDPRTDQVAFTAAYSDDDTRTATSQSRLLGVSRTLSRNEWRETVSFNYQNEKFVIGGESGSSVLLIPGINWSRTWSDARLYVTRGMRLAFDVRGASDNLGSDTTFIQGRIQTKGIHTLGENGRVIGRAEIGGTSVNEFAALPPSIRFFAGGDQSVRGYAFNTLGPTNAAGDVIGGRRMFIASIEYEHHIFGDWAAAVFYDVGNALNDFSDPLKKGTGVGVRWRSPVGQVRLDAATALSDAGHPWRIHVNIGPDL